MATRVGLSDESKAKIEAAIARLREKIFLPRFRSQFATRLPDDTGFRECQFAGAFVTQVNSSVCDLLTEAECSRVHQLIVSQIDHDLVREVEKIATLPDGVSSLVKTLTEDELYGDLYR